MGFGAGAQDTSKIDKEKAEMMKQRNAMMKQQMEMQAKRAELFDKQSNANRANSFVQTEAAEAQRNMATGLAEVARKENEVKSREIKTMVKSKMQSNNDNYRNSTSNSSALSGLLGGK